MVYLIGPYLGYNVIPYIQGFFIAVNQVLQLTGASWFQLNSAPPPPIGVQWFVYWLTFSGFLYLIIGAIRLIVIGWNAQQTGVGPPR